MNTLLSCFTLGRHSNLLYQVITITCCRESHLFYQKGQRDDIFVVPEESTSIFVCPCLLYRNILICGKVICRFMEFISTLRKTIFLLGVKTYFFRFTMNTKLSNMHAFCQVAFHPLTLQGPGLYTIGCRLGRPPVLYPRKSQLACHWLW